MPHSVPPREDPSGGVPGAGMVVGSNATQPSPGPPGESSSSGPGAVLVAVSNVTQPSPGPPDLVRGVAGSNVSSPDAQVVIRDVKNPYANVSWDEAQALAAQKRRGVAGPSVSPPNVQAASGTLGGVVGSNITPSTQAGKQPSITERRDPKTAVDLTQDTGEEEYDSSDDVQFICAEPANISDLAIG